LPKRLTLAILVSVHEISPEQARQALERAAESSSRVRSHTASLRTYNLVTAASWAASLLLYGFLEPLPVRFAAWAAVLLLSLAAMVWWYWRRRATALFVRPPRGRYLGYTVPMGVIQIVTLIVGEGAGLHGEPWFWIPAAIAVAVPLTVLAFRVPKT
jgi:hypothetical protein